jgi:chaperonin GroES
MTETITVRDNESGALEIDGDTTKIKLTLQPLHDRVVVKRQEAEEKIGSLYVPDTAKEKPVRGTVLAVGEGKRDDLGKRITPDVKIGDEVIFGKYAGTEVKLDGEMHVLLREDEILAIVRRAPVTSE